MGNGAGIAGQSPSLNQFGALVLDRRPVSVFGDRQEVEPDALERAQADGALSSPDSRLSTLEPLVYGRRRTSEI